MYSLERIFAAKDRCRIPISGHDLDNDPLTDNYAGPLGGMKYSGGARELSIEGLDEFRETKHVHQLIMNTTPSSAGAA